MGTAKPVQREQDCIVIGAGISGILAALSLKERGRDPLVLEKSRGVGGRMATRRIGEVVFDHGAQYFTARNQAFRKLISKWLEEGILRQWAESFPTPGNRAHDGFPKYCGVYGMSAICKQLAKSLVLKLEQKVITISPDNGKWSLSTESGELYVTGTLIVTAPMPQTLALLDAAEIRLPDDIRLGLYTIAYDPCIAVMAVLDGESNIPPPGGIELGGEPIYWMADNKLKGISSGGHGVTIHAGPNFSQSVWNSPDDEIVARIFEEAEEWLGRVPVGHQLHRWRYSRTTATFPEPYLLVKDPATLVLCGDGFWDARIEGAALSGLAAAEAAMRAG